MGGSAMGPDFNMRSHSRTAKVSIRPCLSASALATSALQISRAVGGLVGASRKPIRRTADAFDQPRDIAKVPGQHDASRLLDRKNMSVLPVRRGRPYGPAGGHTRGVGAPECVNNFETPVAGGLVSNAALPRVRVAWVLES